MSLICPRYLISEISRYLLPPLVNAVKASTGSACGKSVRTAARCLYVARFVVPCQAAQMRFREVADGHLADDAHHRKAPAVMRPAQRRSPQSLAR